LTIFGYIDPASKLDWFVNIDIADVFG